MIDWHLTFEWWTDRSLNTQWLNTQWLEHSYDETGGIVNPHSGIMYTRIIPLYVKEQESQHFYFEHIKESTQLGNIVKLDRGIWVPLLGMKT